MQDGQRLDQRQTETRTLFRAREFAVDLLERLTEFLEVCARNADAGVADANLQSVALDRCVNLHLAAPRRELHAIAEQICEYLLHRPLVREDGARVSCDRAPQNHA